MFTDPFMHRIVTGPAFYIKHAEVLITTASQLCLGLGKAMPGKSFISKRHLNCIFLMVFKLCFSENWNNVLCFVISYGTMCFLLFLGCANSIGEIFLVRNQIQQKFKMIYHILSLYFKIQKLLKSADTLRVENLTTNCLALCHFLYLYFKIQNFLLLKPVWTSLVESWNTVLWYFVV